MEHILEDTITLPVPIETAFAFFAEAENLERITPPELRFRIVTPRPIRIELGTRIDYKLRLFGVPFRWKTLISEWAPPHRFTDEQLSGPYALWVHSHTFEATGDGTVIRDRVRYRLPVAPLGNVALPVVRRQLARIFAYRRRAVAEALAPRRTD